MKISYFFIACLLLVGCQQIREVDIEKYGLSAEFEQLAENGIHGYSQDKDGTIIFFVDEPTEATRKKVEEALTKIFGSSIDFILEENGQYIIDVEHTFN